MRYGIFRTIEELVAAPNLAELEVAKRNQASKREPPCQTTPSLLNNVRAKSPTNRTKSRRKAKLTSSATWRPRYEEQPLPIGRLLVRNGFKCSARADGFIWLVGFVLGIGIRAFS